MYYNIVLYVRYKPGTGISSASIVSRIFTCCHVGASVQFALCANLLCALPLSKKRNAEIENRKTSSKVRTEEEKVVRPAEDLCKQGDI